MSTNPVVSFSNVIPEPPDATTIRKSYMMKVFDSINFFLYNATEDSSTFDPSDMGKEFYLFYQLGKAMGITTPPNFVTTGSWPGVSASKSGFTTANNSVMPKVISPSTLMVDNGLSMDQGTYSAYWGPNSDKLLFNWELDKFNGSAITTTDWFKYAQVGAYFGSQYVSIKAKNDKNTENVLEFHLPEVADPPTGDWVSTNMVGGGAFVLMLNILGVTPGQAQPIDNESHRWSIVITFGDVTMTIADASSMKVKIAGEDNETTVNLAEGMAKEGPPQQQHMADKPPILINVTPCWNGIFVTSGSQETPEVVRTASTFCRKLKAASIQDSAYSNWFDPTSPDNVEVGTGSGPTSVLVDLGTSIDVVAKNCRFEIAYNPRFFTKNMKMDGWLLLSKDTSEISYSYNIYTIFTKNGTDYSIATPTAHDSGHEGSEEGSEYFDIPFSMTETDYQRFAGEIFAYVLEVKETRNYSIKNGNGNFDLVWTGGTPGGSGGTWSKYIKSVSVTVGIDGSSGSISVDKYGVAGQEAVAVQSIGAVVLSATGGTGTVAGNIFHGLGMGIANTDQAGDSTWTIPLVGLEKKLEDIALINPPFMDGETLSTAIDFLSRYAGIVSDMSAADPTIRLSATEEINSARFDWKSGTSVKSALEDVLQDVLHWYCIRDGVLHIYQLDSTGLPITLGPDRSGGYDSTNMISNDKTPDFEDLKNYIVAMALQGEPGGTGTDLQSVPTFPLIEARTKATVPDVPWAKCLVRVFPGVLDPTKLSDIADRMSNSTSLYELSGKLSIPGNADIKPYDTWGNLVIASVTHTVDLEAKTWVTDLDFIRVAN